MRRGLANHVSVEYFGLVVDGEPDADLMLSSDKWLHLPPLKYVDSFYCTNDSGRVTSIIRQGHRPYRVHRLKPIVLFLLLFFFLFLSLSLYHTGVSKLGHGVVAWVGPCVEIRHLIDGYVRVYD